MINIPKDIYGVKIPKRLRKRLEIFCKGLVPLDLVNEIRSEDTHGFLAYIEWSIKNFPSIKMLESIKKGGTANGRNSWGAC